MRILFLSGWYPYPPNNGSKLRIYHLLRGLTPAHAVQLIALAESAVPVARTENGAAIDVQVIERRPYHATSRRALLGWLSPTPRALVDTYTPAMAQAIEHALDRRPYDLVIASQWSTAAYGSHFYPIPAIFEELELGTFEAKKAHAPTLLHRLRHELPILKLRVYLRRLLGYFKACSVVSEPEKALVRQMAPEYNAIEVIPNGVNLADYRDTHAVPTRDTLIFTGSLSYFANHEAMTWFLDKVYPLIQMRVPGVRLIITGDHANLPLPSASNVTLTGFVADPRPLTAAACISIVPIRLGGGTRLKILEAMALRTPVVATSKGAEGLNVRHDEHLLLADTPIAFADAVTRLLMEPALRQRLADNAYQLVREEYDWSVILPHFMNTIERVGDTSGAHARALRQEVVSSGPLSP